MRNTQNILAICTMVLMITSCSSCKEEFDTRSYSFIVSRSNSVLANSTVSIQTYGQVYSAKTDNNGKCLINIPNSVTLPTYTIVTIDHSSIKPYALSVSGVPNAKSNTPVNCTNNPTIVRLREVALHHLGDDSYSGSENSQLQLPTEGYQKSFNYTLPATPGIMPRIQIYARGIQCAPKIFFNGIETASLGNSALNGDLTLYDFQLSGNASTIFHAGNNVLTIKTTKCSSSDYDDFEFCGLLLYYQ